LSGGLTELCGLFDLLSWLAELLCGLSDRLCRLTELLCGLFDVLSRLTELCRLSDLFDALELLFPPDHLCALACFRLLRGLVLEALLDPSGLSTLRCDLLARHLALLEPTERLCVLAGLDLLWLSNTNCLLAYLAVLLAQVAGFQWALGDSASLVALWNLLAGVLLGLLPDRVLLGLLSVVRLLLWVLLLCFDW
jgi:hypothetical protein